MLRFVRQKQNIGEYRRFRRRWRGYPVYSYPVNNRAGSHKGYGTFSVGFPAPIDFVLRRLAKLAYPACPLLFAQTNVTADGRVLLCCNDYEHTTVMGDLDSSGLHDIFNSPRYRSIRDNARKGRYEGMCRRCSIYQEWIA